MQNDTPITELEPGTSTNKAIKTLKNLTPIIEEATTTLLELQSDTPSPRVGDTGKSSPRVCNKSTRVADAASPRVNEVRSRYSIGTKISKAFDGIEYSGKIIRDNGRYY